MTDTTETERNRTLATEAFAEFAKGHTDFLRTVIAEDFVEHSPGNPSGRDAFIDYLANAPVAAAKLDLKRVVAEGPYVTMHCHMVSPGDANGIAAVDIWRFEDGWIVEHWDVVQSVPDADQLPNGMF